MTQEDIASSLVYLAARCAALERVLVLREREIEALKKQIEQSTEKLDA